MLDLFRFHLDLFDEWQEELNRPFKPLRRFFKIYIRGVAGAAQLRQQLMDTDNTTDVRILLDEFEANTELNTPAILGVE